jgi:hypothetical protein
MEVWASLSIPLALCCEKQAYTRHDIDLRISQIDEQD